MYSHKSTRLREEITTLADIGLRALYVNHTLDVRATETSRSGLTSHHSGFCGLSPKVDVVSVSALADVDVSQYNAIGVDEGQFFDDLDTVVRRWVISQAKIVFVASLDGDHRMQPFGKAHTLICICDPGNVTKLGAVCEICMKDSLHSGHFVRTLAGFTFKLIPDAKTVDIGGKDKYLPVCMQCYQKKNICGSGREGTE